MFWKLVLSCFLVLSVSAVSAQEPNDSDVQFRNETKVYLPSFKKKDRNGKEQKFVTPFFMGVFRVGQNVKHFVTERAGFGFDIRLNKYFKFTPSYYYIASQKLKNKKAFEHRIRFDLTGEKKWRFFSISDRNRVEYRSKHSKNDSVRYRNKLRLKIPVRNGGNELFSVFAATEPHYDFEKKEWSRNEFSTGISRKITKSMSTEVFYLLQNNTGNSFRMLNAFGVNLKFTID